MCEFNINIEHEIEQLAAHLDSLRVLCETSSKMNDRDRAFASDLYSSFVSRGSLSSKQWAWVTRLTERYAELEPIYGSFVPILVMFRLTQASPNAIQKPRVRLLSSEGRFVQLTFYPDKDAGRQVEVHIDGWQGHGYRKFAGWVCDDHIVPYRSDRMTKDVRAVIQDLALDPVGTMKAMAGLLGVCGFCANRLSDDRSKKAGYGETCADHYGLPWGDKQGKKELFQPVPASPNAKSIFGDAPHV